MASLERDAKFVECESTVEFVLGFSFVEKAEKLGPFFLVDGGPFLRVG